MGIKGIGLLELIASISIFAVVIFGGTTVLLNTQKLDLDAQENQWVSVRHHEIRSYMKSPASWNQIVADNPLMNCFTANCAGINGPQNLILTISGVTLDGNNPGTGMTRFGDFCTTFDPVVGDLQCIYGLSLKWEALCDDAACTHPQPKMTVQFNRKEKNVPLNTMKYNDIVVFRDPKLATMDEVCTAMGGNLVLVGANPPTYTCTIPPLLGSCNVAAGEYVLGFDNAGNVNCGKPFLGQCLPNAVLVGFNANGSINCNMNPCPP